jgi:acylphosphatase
MGWIKNNASGDVEAMITGPDEALQEFIDWCKRGPSGAIVKEVMVKEEVETIRLKGFEIIR